MDNPFLFLVAFFAACCALLAAYGDICINWPGTIIYTAACIACLMVAMP